MEATYTAFEGTRRLASGLFAGVVGRAIEAVRAGATANVVVFDDATGLMVEFDPREVGGGELVAVDAAEDASVPQARGPGRPRLGVVGREVTLLPRHWDWLNGQPGGASVALRKLVEEARRTHAGRDRARKAQTAAYHFMNAMAGDEPGYEEALRALFANDRARFAEQVEGWPIDVREHARSLAEQAFQLAGEAAGR